MRPRDHAASGGTVETLVRAAAIEIIPLRGVADKVANIPDNTTITITCSPKFGLERTLEHAAHAARAGYRVVPHLAARQVADKAELARFVGRLGDIGVTDLFVIGGDATEPAGVYRSSLELLESLAGLDHGIRTIGVAGYPEGHPRVSRENLLEVLRLKQPYADYMVSQMCFDSVALLEWLRTMRAADIKLPLHVGLAAPMNTRKLAELSLRIGVGASIRYLTKQHGILGNLMRGNAYQPERLLFQIGDRIDEFDIAGVHLFSFNQIAATLEWQRRIGGQEPASAG